MPIKTQLFDLSGKVALVTGGASGLGKGIAQAFVEHGAHVLIGSRTEEKVNQAVEDLKRATEADEADPAEPIIDGVPLDVTNDNSVDHAVRKCVDDFGKIDILVNCAGIIVKKPTFELSLEEFNTIHESHVTGSLRCAKAAGELMREQHAGSIINIASISSYVDLVEVAAYAAAKNGVMGLTRSLANEWAKYGIRTNAIANRFMSW